MIKIAFLPVVLFLVRELLFGISAMAAEIPVLSVADLQTSAASVNAGDVLKLTPAFAADLAAAATTPMLIYAGNNNFTIDGAAAGALSAPTAAGSLHFSINNTGTATITLKDLTLTGGGTKGGIDLDAAGSYVVDGCTVQDIATNYGLTGGKNVSIQNSLFTGNTTKRAIFAPQGSAYTITNSSFLGNPSGAIQLSGAASEAERVTHTVNNCYFADNVISNDLNANSSANRGAAIYIEGSYYTFNITGSVFKRNKVIGTNTGSGANNRFDGGAICVQGEGGLGTVFNLTNSDFEDNFAQDDGGAIIVLGPQRYWGYIRSSIRNCTFTGNTAAGAQYGAMALGIWVTDGSGGAINYFGVTESEITHCTFYNNGITNQIVGGGTSLGSVGGGGAVGVDTGEDFSNIDNLPPCPVLSNNIFVGNYITNPATQSTIALINSVTSNALGNITERSKTGNIFVFPAADSDLQGEDKRTMNNNGNIGYDNKSADFNDNGMAPTGITVGGVLNSIPITPATVFAETTGAGAAAIPVKEEYGALVGAPGYTTQRFCYIPSPVSDEMYRDGNGPYYDATVRYDTRDYPRDDYPNAGAVEIYWTKFDPDTTIGGAWVSGAIPSTAIRSLANSDQFYLVTNPFPDNQVITFPRASIDIASPSDWSFLHWKSDQPVTPGGSDYPEVAPATPVGSTKQTYTAIWSPNPTDYLVDFDLQYEIDSVPQFGTSQRVVAGGTATKPVPDPDNRTGYLFVNWYKEAACNTPWDFNTAITEDTTIYAKWIPDSRGLVPELIPVNPHIRVFVK